MSTLRPYFNSTVYLSGQTVILRTQLFTSASSNSVRSTDGKPPVLAPYDVGTGGSFLQFINQSKHNVLLIFTQS